MKKQWIAVFCTALVISMSACGQATTNASSSVPAQSEPVISESTSSSQPEEIAEAAAEALPAPADSALFRGTVEEFAVSDDGSTVLLMRRALGTGYEPSLKVRLTDVTQFGFDSSQIGNGTFLEVYYGAGATANEDGSVDAIVINTQFSEDSVYYNGILTEIVTEENGEGYLMMDPIEESGMQYRFNFDANTQFYLDQAELKVGDQLNIYHSPMATRSLPPQSYAWEVAPYQAPEEGEQPQPVAELEEVAAQSVPEEILSPER